MKRVKRVKKVKVKRNELDEIFPKESQTNQVVLIRRALATIIQQSISYSNVTSPTNRKSNEHKKGPDVP